MVLFANNCNGFDLSWKLDNIYIKQPQLYHKARYCNGFTFLCTHFNMYTTIILCFRGFARIFSCFMYILPRFLVLYLFAAAGAVENMIFRTYGYDVDLLVTTARFIAYQCSIVIPNTFRRVLLRAVRFVACQDKTLGELYIQRSRMKASISNAAPGYAARNFSVSSSAMFRTREVFLPGAIRGLCRLVANRCLICFWVAVHNYLTVSCMWLCRRRDG